MALAVPKPAALGQSSASQAAGLPESDIPVKTWSPLIVPRELYIREGLVWQSQQPVSLTVEVNGKRDLMKYAAVMQLVNKLGYVARLGQPGAAAKFQNLHLIDVKRRGSIDIHITLGDLSWAKARAADASTAPAATAPTPTPQPPSGAASPDLPELGTSEACVLAGGCADGAVLSGSSSEGTSMQAGMHSVATAAAAATVATAAELEAGTSTDSRSPVDAGSDHDDKATGTSHAPVANTAGQATSATASASASATATAAASGSASASASASASGSASGSASAAGAASASAVATAAPVASPSTRATASLLCSCAFCPCHLDLGFMDAPPCGERPYGDVSPHGPSVITDHQWIPQVCFGSRYTQASGRPPAQQPGLPSRLSSPPVPPATDVEAPPPAVVGHVSHISRERLRNLCLPGLMRASPQTATGAKGGPPAAACCGGGGSAHAGATMPMPFGGDTAQVLPVRAVRGSLTTGGSGSVSTACLRTQSRPVPGSGAESGPASAAQAPASAGDLIGWELVLPPELAARRVDDKHALVQYEIDGEVEDCKMQYRIVQLDDIWTVALQGVSRPLRGLRLLSLGETAEGDLFIQAVTPGLQQQDNGGAPLPYNFGAAAPKPVPAGPCPPNTVPPAPATAPGATLPESSVVISRSASGRQRRPSLKAREEAASAGGQLSAGGGSLASAAPIARAGPGPGPGSVPAPVLALPPLSTGRLDPGQSGPGDAAVALPSGVPLLALPPALPSALQQQRRRGRPPRAAPLARTPSLQAEDGDGDDPGAAAVAATPMEERGDAQVQGGHSNRVYDGRARGGGFGAVVRTATAKRTRVGDRAPAVAASPSPYSDDGCGGGSVGGKEPQHKEMDALMDVFEQGDNGEGLSAGGGVSVLRRRFMMGAAPPAPSAAAAAVGLAVAPPSQPATAALVNAAASARPRRALNTGAPAAVAVPSPLTIPERDDAPVVHVEGAGNGPSGPAARGRLPAGDTPSRGRGSRKRASATAAAGPPAFAGPCPKRARAGVDTAGAPLTQHQVRQQQHLLLHRQPALASAVCEAQLQQQLPVASSRKESPQGSGAVASPDADVFPRAAAAVFEAHGRSLRARRAGRGAYRREEQGSGSSCSSSSSEGEGSDDGRGQEGDEPSTSGAGGGLEDGGSAAARSGAVASSSVLTAHHMGHQTQQGRPKPRCRANAGKSKTKPIRHPSKITNVVRNAGAILLMIGRNPLMYEKQLRATFGNNPDTSKALRLLEEQGKVLRGGLGYRMHPYHYTLTPVGIEEYECQLRGQGPSYTFALAMGVPLPPTGTSTSTASVESILADAAAGAGAGGVELLQDQDAGCTVAVAAAVPGAWVRESAFSASIGNDDAVAVAAIVAAAATVAPSAPSAPAPEGCTAWPMDVDTGAAPAIAPGPGVPAAGSSPRVSSAILAMYSQPMDQPVKSRPNPSGISVGVSERALVPSAGVSPSQALGPMAATTPHVAVEAMAASVGGHAAAAAGSTLLGQCPSVSGCPGEHGQQPSPTAVAAEASVVPCPQSTAGTACTAATGGGLATRAAVAPWGASSHCAQNGGGGDLAGVPQGCGLGVGVGGTALDAAARPLGHCPSPFDATLGAAAQRPQPQHAALCGGSSATTAAADAGPSERSSPSATAATAVAAVPPTASPAAAGVAAAAAAATPPASQALAMYVYPHPMAHPPPFNQQPATAAACQPPPLQSAKKETESGESAGVGVQAAQQLSPYGNSYALYGYVPTPFGYVPYTMYNAYASAAATAAATAVAGASGGVPGAMQPPLMPATAPAMHLPLPGGMMHAPGGHAGTAAGQPAAPMTLCAAPFLHPFPSLPFVAAAPAAQGTTAAVAAGSAPQPPLPQGLPAHALTLPPQPQPQPQPQLKVEVVEAQAPLGATSQQISVAFSPLEGRAPSAATTATSLTSQMVAHPPARTLLPQPQPPAAAPALPTPPAPTSATLHATPLVVASQFRYVMEVPGGGSFRAEVPGTDGRVYYSPGFSEAMQAAAAADLLLCKLRPGEQLNLGISAQEEASLASMSVEQVQAMLWSMSHRV